MLQVINISYDKIGVELFFKKVVEKPLNNFVSPCVTKILRFEGKTIIFGVRCFRVK